MARRLFVVEDDLMFAQRVRAAARRLGISLEGISAAEARTRRWDGDEVVAVQATLRPDQQVALVEALTGRRPSPVVVAVTGHLETQLRRRLKARGATLAAHSGMDRVLARAVGIGGARDDDQSRAEP